MKLRKVWEAECSGCYMRYRTTAKNKMEAETYFKAVLGFETLGYIGNAKMREERDYCYTCKKAAKDALIAAHFSKQ